MNAVKATHKQIYYKYAVQEWKHCLPSSEVIYAKWLKPFVKGIEVNQHKDPNHFAKKKKCVTIQLIPQKSDFKFWNPSKGVKLGNKQRLSSTLLGVVLRRRY